MVKTSCHKETPDNDSVLDINQCLCLPKAELNTKNEPKQPRVRLGSFFVFNSIREKVPRYDSDVKYA